MHCCTTLFKPLEIYRIYFSRLNQPGVVSVQGLSIKNKWPFPDYMQNGFHRSLSAASMVVLPVFVALWVWSTEILGEAMCFWKNVALSQCFCTSIHRSTNLQSQVKPLPRIQTPDSSTVVQGGVQMRMKNPQTSADRLSQSKSMVLQDSDLPQRPVCRLQRTTVPHRHSSQFH